MQIENFTSMVEPFKDKMYRVALRIVKDNFEAEDVVQEVMIKIWKNQERFNEIQNQEAWCMTLTKNLAIDKTRSKHNRVDGFKEGAVIKDSGANPHRILEARDTLSHVRKILESLPDNQRTVIELRDIEEYTYQEIADETDMTLEQVKVLIHRGRKAMRLKLLKLK
jgi:RNA polymerase sigma-70 factor (ECF subfamily)